MVRAGVMLVLECFRWVKPAASLKHLVFELIGDARQTGFPLGKTGGLIEAVQRLVIVARGHRVFPLGKTGGLIEAAV